MSTGSPGTRRRASSAARTPSSWKPGGSRTSTTQTSGRCSSTAARNASASADGGDHVEARVAQQAREAVAQQREVLGDHDAHGSSARTMVGPPAGLATRQRAVERLHAAPQPGEAGPARVGAAAPVVGHLDPEAPADDRRADR